MYFVIIATFKSDFFVVNEWKFACLLIKNFFIVQNLEDKQAAISKNACDLSKEIVDCIR